MKLNLLLQNTKKNKKIVGGAKNPGVALCDLLAGSHNFYFLIC